MGAPAVSPRVRPAPRPKPAPRRRRTTAPAGRAAAARPRGPLAAGGNVAMLPVNAIGGIADSGFVVGMARGRAWIVVLGILLCGIVAINVLGLSLSAAGSETSTKIDELQRQNSVLRARIANRLSSERISESAAALGLQVPAPDAVDYLRARRSDAERAAERLAGGEIGTGASVAPTDVTTDAATTDPTATAGAVPPAPTTTAPTTTAPVAPAADPTATVP
ncbi:MAG: hypothetical protein KJ006_01140 [Thermoleophilia bacterium]|nr:hypothetical protein [Thermoleophilia bacterium]